MFEEFCSWVRHRDGRWAGEPLRLSIEQRYFAHCVLGILTHDPELKMDVRYFTEAVLFVARKWGKSLFISALGAFLLMMDGEQGGQVWALATVKSQAAIVYDNVKSLLRSSEVLTPPDNPRALWRTRRDRSNAEIIEIPALNAYMKAGSKNADQQ